MKSTITLLLALSVFTFTFAQEEKEERTQENEEETTTISFKGKVITITTEGDTDTTIVINGDKDDLDEKWDVNLWRGLEFGVNGYFTDNDFGINSDPANVYLELNYAKSFMLNLNFAEFNTRIGTEKFRFFTGLGFRFNRYAFKSTSATLAYDETNIFNGTDSTKTFDKNYLNTTYISAPVFLTFMPGNDPDQSFHISAGAIVNYRIGSRLKQKYVTQDQKRKDIEKGHYHLNPFLIDASVRIGVGDFSIYANYGLNGLFESGKGPDYAPFSAGLSWSF
ncbi:outer membrane beta-barrel protein [Brumimicrobium mesophilum]|uniref:outer membrane beta-barrel protein n=1 Tax=Brumimicrobium mesophilum TaxID=392717 RepID=UPI000D1441DA|nr:outer membrane beta-barrel protein [Brumimicrobium mesophilum]